MEKYINNITQGDCISVLKEMDNQSVDLMITSPPYNVGINYDTHVDT